MSNSIFKRKPYEPSAKELKKRQKYYRPATTNIETLKTGKFTVIKSNLGGVS
jgi:hypothetical protein